MVPTIQYLRDSGRRALAAAGSLPANSDERQQLICLEVDLLIAHLLGISRLSVITRGAEPVSPDQAEEFNHLIARRIRFEPIAYITGTKEFFGRSFMVTPAVLIPRPETEMIVEQTLDILSESPRPYFITDIGTGSGAIILSIAAELRDRLGAEALSGGLLIGSDISPDALELAKLNAAALGLRGLVEFVQSDLLAQPLARAAISPVGGTRIIVSNLPYIADGEGLAAEVSNFEPTLALRAGVQGLDLFIRLAGELHSELAAGVFLLLECGAGQHREVERIFLSAGAQTAHTIFDLAGIGRVVAINR